MVRDERREEEIDSEVPGERSGAQEANEANIGEEGEKVRVLNGNPMDRVQKEPQGARRGSPGLWVAAEGEAVWVRGGQGNSEESRAPVDTSEGLQHCIEGGGREGGQRGRGDLSEEEVSVCLQPEGEEEACEVT